VGGNDSSFLAMQRPAGRLDWIGIRWGVPCSALFHLAIVSLALLVLPEPREPKALPKEIPVEVVRKAPIKKPAAKPKTQARKIPPKPKVQARKIPPKPKTEPKKPAKLPGLAEKKSDPGKKPAPAPAKKIAEAKPLTPKKGTVAPEPKLPAPKKESVAPEPKTAITPNPKRADREDPVKKLPPLARLSPKPAPPPLTAAKPRGAALPRLPSLRPKPTPPPKPKLGGLKAPQQLAAVPRLKIKPEKLLGLWVLSPLTFKLPNACGTRTITGTMDLLDHRMSKDGTAVLYLAEIRTTNHWERCPQQASLYRGLLVVEGNRVYFADRKGSSNLGYVSERRILLRGGLGASVWHRE
jgi:hypothetical protein